MAAMYPKGHDLSWKEPRESLGHCTFPRDLVEGRPCLGCSAVVTSNFSLRDAFAGRSAATAIKLRSNKNSPIYRRRSTYSLTGQIDDAYVAFMHSEAAACFNSENLQIVLLNTASFLKDGFVIYPGTHLVSLNYTQHISAFMASLFPYRF